MKNKDGIKLDHYSPSLLSIKCPRRLIRYVSDKAKEGIPAEIAEIGGRLHGLASDALLGGDFIALEAQLPHEVSYLKRLHKRGEFNTEHWLRREIYMKETGKKKLMIGRCDIKDKAECKIVDIKSSWVMNIGKTTEQQLETYAWFALAEWKRVKTAIYWIRFDRLQEAKTYDEFDVSEIEDRLAQEINRVDNLIEAGAEKPMPNMQGCSYCDWAVSCPDVELLDDTTDRELATEYIKRTNAVKKVEEILRARLKDSETGKVDIDEERFIGYYDYDSISVDTAEFMVLAGKLKIPMEQVMELLSINMKKFNKFLKTAPAFENLPVLNIKSRWSGAKGSSKK